jgi:hypothetical protein
MEGIAATARVCRSRARRMILIALAVSSGPMAVAMPGNEEWVAAEHEWRALRREALVVADLPDFAALLGRARVAALHAGSMAGDPGLPPDAARRLLRASDAGDAWLTRALALALRGEEIGVAAEIRSLADGPVAGLYHQLRGFEPSARIGAWERQAGLEPGQLASAPTTAQQTLVLGSLAGALEESGFPFALVLAGGLHAELARRLPPRMRTYAVAPALGAVSPTQDYRRFVAALAEGENLGGRTLVAASLPGLEPALREAAEVGAEWALVRVLLAWRAHGGPTGWAELSAADLWRAAPRDPFSGRALRLDAARGLVWSVGPDGRDDNGAGEPWLRSGPDRPLRWRPGSCPHRPAESVVDRAR